MYLETIQSPSDLAGLTLEQCTALAGEIREELITTVARNGGHLASNLGAVELTLALHRVFHAPGDKILFDVGHQSYVHKLVTGRRERFRTLREYGGLAGFPRRSESAYDCFETGHASTAISAALGFAKARDCRGEQYHVVAVVGDGALTGGMCYEALNHAGQMRTKMIVVLNDNEMSIAPNVGALSAYLTELRISAGWQSAKKRVRRLSSRPMGKPLYRLIHGSKKMLKSVLLKDTEIGFFETLGFQYFGPIDGHDLKSLEKTLHQAATCPGPCVIHVLTKKGFGYEQAEKKPEAFHGTPPFYIETGGRISLPKTKSCGHLVADTLAEMCAEDPRILTITAAMELGTGLDHLAEKYPDRVMDVGIAEEHAATLAAGLAAGGMKPYFAVYASFFQRCYDQMIHDICMQDLPVTFLLDRSGVGGEDGQTHHGVFDFAELLPVPGMTALAPCDSEELRQMVRWTREWDHPCAIRYPKHAAPLEEAAGGGFELGKWRCLAAGEDATLLAVGTMVRTALRVRQLLREKGLTAAVYNCSTVKPLDRHTLAALRRQPPVFTLEEHMTTGGFGASVVLACLEGGYAMPAACFGVGDQYLQHGAHDLLLRDAGLTAEQIAAKILEKMEARAH